MLFRFLNRLNATTGLFNGHYVDAKALYVLRFKEIPSVTFVGELDITKAFDYILENLGTKITTIYPAIILIILFLTSRIMLS